MSSYKSSLSINLLFFHFLCLSFDLLKVESFNQSKKLINGEIEGVVHESVCEKNRVIRKFDLLDCVRHSDLELCFCFFSVTDSLSQLLKRRRIYKQEVSLQRLSV